MSTLSTVLSLLDSGDFYSAHQKVRTSVTRLLSSRSGPKSTIFDKKAQEASELLWQSSKKLLELNQIGSGSDLANFLIELYKSRSVECGEEQRAQVLQLIALIGPSGSWRKTFTDAVFSWSAATGSGAAGDAAIHGYFGEVLFKEQNYHLATLHLLVCPTQDAARTLADVMFAWSKLDGEGVTAVGRYAARGTLSYLESESILPARVFLSHFLSLVLSSYPQLLVVSFPFPPPTSPLAKTDPSSITSDDQLIMTKLSSLNFLQLTVRTCQLGQGESIEKVKGVDGTFKGVKGKGRLNWLTLVGRYERDVSWLKKPDCKESTQALGTIYFGIKPPRAAGNPMMDMISNMFGGGGGAAPAIAGR